MAWSTFVALGDSLSAGRGDPDVDGRLMGWPVRLSDLLGCSLTNLAADRATTTQVLSEQLPALGAFEPDLVSVTVGMNDIRAPEFTGEAFAAELRRIFDGLDATGATLLTCTLPDIAERLPVDPALVPLVRERMGEVSEIIRAEAAGRGALCVDSWVRPEVADPAIYSEDRLHLNGRGHQLLAGAFAELLA